MNHKKLHEEANSNLIPGWNYHADRSSATQLSAIYKLLDERLPAAPMAVIESAPWPVQDVVDNPLSDGGMTFHCQSHNADTLTVREVSDGRYDFHATGEVDDAETVIYLSAADAKRLARAILGST